jgi:hypothetical protein
MRIKYNEVIPRFYGVAYRDYQRMCLVCFLFPFNHVVGIAYLIWYKIRHAKYVLNYFENNKENIIKDDFNTKTKEWVDEQERKSLITKTEYKQRKDGEWFCISPEHKLKCCDCGLVHIIRVRKQKGKFYMQAVRDNRATVQVRRHQYFDVQPVLKVRQDTKTVPNKR